MSVCLINFRSRSSRLSRLLPCCSRQDLVTRYQEEKLVLQQFKKQMRIIHVLKKHIKKSFIVRLNQLQCKKTVLRLKKSRHHRRHQQPVVLETRMTTTLSSMNMKYMFVMQMSFDTFSVGKFQSMFDDSSIFGCACTQCIPLLL